MIASRAAAVGCVALASASCVIENPTAYPLRDGPYYASWDTVIANDCFETGLPIPRGYTLVLHAEPDDGGEVEVAWPALSDALVPMVGTIANDGGYEISGFVPYVLTTGCTVGVTTRATGMGISKTLATFRLTAAFDASTTAMNGLPSDCSEFQGETVDNFPFPTLSDPVDGACAVTVKGLASFRRPWSL